MRAAFDFCFIFSDLIYAALRFSFLFFIFNFYYFVVVFILILSSVCLLDYFPNYLLLLYMYIFDLSLCFYLKRIQQCWTRTTNATTIIYQLLLYVNIYVYIFESVVKFAVYSWNIYILLLSLSLSRSLSLSLPLYRYLCLLYCRFGFQVSFVGFADRFFISNLYLGITVYVGTTVALWALAICDHQ